MSSCAIGSTSSRVPMLMEGKVSRTVPSIAFPWIVPVSVNVVPDSATVTDVDPVAAPLDQPPAGPREALPGRGAGYRCPFWEDHRIRAHPGCRDADDDAALIGEEPVRRIAQGNPCLRPKIAEGLPVWAHQRMPLDGRRA